MHGVVEVRQNKFLQCLPLWRLRRTFATNIVNLNWAKERRDYLQLSVWKGFVRTMMLEDNGGIFERCTDKFVVYYSDCQYQSSCK